MAVVVPARAQTSRISSGHAAPAHCRDHRALLRTNLATVIRRLLFIKSVNEIYQAATTKCYVTKFNYYFIRKHCNSY